jgi:hypothetical protein
MPATIIADDGRLADPARESAHQAGEDHDHDQVEEDVGDDLCDGARLHEISGWRVTVG